MYQCISDDGKWELESTGDRKGVEGHTAASNTGPWWKIEKEAHSK